MRRLLVPALVVAGLSVVPGPLDPAAGAVAAVMPVTLAGFSDIAVDEAHGHVFVSQGAKGGVVVADLHGDAVTTIDSLVGAADLELTPSGAEVVVAVRAGHKVAAIDTATLAVTEWSVGDRCPNSVGAAGDDVIWFASVCQDLGYGSIAGLDRTDGTIIDVPGWTNRQPAVHTRPSVPGTVTAFDFAGHVAVYDETLVDGNPTLQPVSTRFISDGVDDIELTADGSGLAIAEYGGSPRTWSTGDLDVALSDGYRSDSAHYRPYLHLRADGMLLIGPEVFEPGRYQRLTLLDLGAEVVGAHWGAERLYAVTKDYERPRVLRLRSTVVKAPSQVGIKVSDEKIVIGGKTRLDLSLTTRSSNRRVVVKAVTAGGTKVVARPRVPAAGASLRIEPRRNTTYVAAYVGDAEVAASRDSATVSVTPRISLRALDAGTVRHGVAYYRSGQTARLRATVEAWPGGCVTFHIYFRRIREWIWADSATCVHVNTRGVAELRVRSRSGERYYANRIVAVFVPNDNNLAKSSPGRQIQFCPGSVPCRAPVGRAGFRQPRVGPVT